MHDLSSVIPRCRSVAEALKGERPGCQLGRTSFEARGAMLLHRTTHTSSDNGFAIARG